jgi:hypothetical protein
MKVEGSIFTFHLCKRSHGVDRCTYVTSVGYKICQRKCVRGMIAQSV